MTRTSEDLVGLLACLLEEEREMLLSGSLDRMPEILDRKTSIIRGLSDFKSEDLRQLSALRTSILRNEQLLDEAVRGLRTVSRRLADLRRVRDNLDTYTERGELKRIRSGSSSVERRA